MTIGALDEYQDISDYHKTGNLCIPLSIFNKEFGTDFKKTDFIKIPKAREVAAGNILWEGYISYNKARVDLMKYLMHLEEDENALCKTLAEIVRVRENACFLFGGKGSYLDGKFVEEIKRAKNLKCNFKKLLRAEKKK